MDNFLFILEEIILNTKGVTVDSSVNLPIEINNVLKNLPESKELFLTADLEISKLQGFEEGIDSFKNNLNEKLDQLLDECEASEDFILQVDKIIEKVYRNCLKEF